MVYRTGVRHGPDWLKLGPDIHRSAIFRWHIEASDNPTLVAWQCLEGPGNAKGTEVSFTLKPTTANETTLSISHRGWEPNDPKIETCIDIWRTLMQHLQRYCETGVANPAYR